MYSRNYQAGEIPTLPESYSGVAFREPEPIPEDAPKSIPKSADVKFTTSPAPPDPNLTAAPEPEPAPEPETIPTGGLLSGIMDGLPLKGLFSGVSGFNLGRLGLNKIGTEEILIIGLALFLFLSREGDKECAILLILLLFIH
jgi:hypothetical protein